MIWAFVDIVDSVSCAGRPVRSLCLVDERPDSDPTCEPRENLIAQMVWQVVVSARCRSWWRQKRSSGPPGSQEKSMTEYLLSVHGPAERGELGDYGSKEEMEEAFAATEAFNERLRADGYWVFAGGLQEASTATVVDGRGETPVMTDGPYLETKEVIGGFWVIEAPDLDVALRLAAEGSRACRGKVEVRPFEGIG
jgi:hypothetical protein